MPAKKKIVNVSENTQLNDRESALQRPEQFIKNVLSVKQFYLTYGRDGRLKYSEFVANLALVHLLIEIVSNATDNSAKNGTINKLSSTIATALAATGKGKNTTNILTEICRVSDALVLVEMTKFYMSVTNYGAPFDIDFTSHLGGWMFIPEKCFLCRNFGSNFNDDQNPRIGAGRNGVGATLPVYYSKYFEVECVDVERGRYFFMSLSTNGHPDTKKIRVWPEPIMKAGVPTMINGTESATPPPDDILATFRAGRSFTRVKWFPDSEEGDLRPADLSEFGKTLLPGDDLIIRRSSPKGDSEELRVKCVQNGPSPIVGISPTQTFPLIGVPGLRHAKCVRTSTSVPPTTCIFQGGTFISDNEIDLAARHALDFTICGVPILLRRTWTDGQSKEELLLPTSVLEYGKLLFADTPSYAFDWTSEDNNITCKIAYFDTPGTAIQMGFVNGVWAEPGIHMFAAQHALLDKIKLEPEIKKFAPDLNLVHFKKHVSTICLCIGFNPKQEGQTKGSLGSISGKTSFKIESISEHDVHKICYGSKIWKSIQAMMESGKNKELGELKVGLKKRKAPGYIPANVTGPNAILALAEGDSCVVYAAIVKNQQPHSDSIGIFPLRGVPKNLYGLTAADALKNPTFASLMNTCNLDIDKKYETEAELKTLRYGVFMFFGDPDLDGFHIIALMLANFQHFWPALFNQRRVGMYRTPVVRIYANGQSERILARYYSDREYTAAIANGTAPKGRIKRNKGLGTVDVGELDEPAAEVMDDIMYATVVWFDMGQYGTQALHAFFSSGNAAMRRTCITNMARSCQEIEGTHVIDPNCRLTQLGPAPIHRRDVSSYVEKEVVQYAVGSLFRQLPGAKDLCKDAQRKILAYVLEHTNFGSRHELQKVEQLAGKIGEAQHYHHGQPILGATLKRMTVSGFSGANNVPVFRKHSNVGSKLNWPKDAAADRYVFVSCSEWMKYAFHRNIYDCVPRIISEGDEIEPIWIPCVIPFGIMNGITGIGTGWSTYQPPCHPTSILQLLHERVRADLEGRKPNHVEIVFWYCGFLGSISVVHNTKAQECLQDEPLITYKISEDGQIVEDETPTTENIPPHPLKEPEEIFAAKAIRATGLWRMSDPLPRSAKGVVAMMHITEVPPETRLNNLIATIRELEEEDYVLSFRHETKYGIDFLLGLSQKGLDFFNSGKLVKKLQLVATYSLTNFNLLNDFGAPVKFNDVYEYMEFFYRNIIDIYEISRQRQIKSLEDDIVLTLERKRYVMACVSTPPLISLGKMTKAALIAALDSIDVKRETVKTVDAFDLTPEGIVDLDNLIEKKRQAVLTLQNTRAQQIYYDHLVALIPHVPTCPMPLRTSEFEWVSQERDVPEKKRKRASKRQ